MLSIDREIAERAAHIRATYNIRIPDALQLGAALSAGCEAFLTNDHDLRRVTDLRVLVLEELEL
jgi:predicted nucleic acid-binding protein